MYSIFNSAAFTGTAFIKDPNDVIPFGISRINYNAKHRKLKGYMRNSKKR